MNIVVLHGQKHKGSTWHITQLLLDELTKDVKDISEFYTNDIPSCVGCFSCIMKDENLCPHRSIVEPIIEAIEQADVIFAESPNYCMEMSGQLKTFFDHMAYRWISHRPHASMKNKIGVAVSTTAGMGARGTAKSIARQMFYWGVAKTYCIPFTVSAMDWNEINPKKKAKITETVQKTGRKIKRRASTVKPGLKSKFMFNMMRSAQKKSTWNPVDRKHWESNGWI